MSSLFCEDCGDKLIYPRDPKDGWQLDDGRTVCHACCSLDFRKECGDIIGLSREIKKKDKTLIH